MKKLIIFLIVFISNIGLASAQFYKSLLPSPAFGDSLTIIVKDFKQNFYAIQGKQLASVGSVDIYNSKAGIPGAAHCIIQRYHSAEDTTASWQAIMYEGENYEEAVRIYKNTFNLIKKSKLKWAEKEFASFAGTIEKPDKSVSFTATSFTLNVADNDYEHFFAELEITNSYNGWEVHLYLHSRKNDEDRY